MLDFDFSDEEDNQVQEDALSTDKELDDKEPDDDESDEMEADNEVDKETVTQADEKKPSVPLLEGVVFLRFRWRRPSRETTC